MHSLQDIDIFYRFLQNTVGIMISSAARIRRGFFYKPLFPLHPLVDSHSNTYAMSLKAKHTTGLVLRDRSLN